ncbi:hypothetical protein ACIQ1J_29555 [Streptomyces sp. NPDC097107]|uniref:hypothetical protein n=1 Tax=Streptomyces sp. NPDC097107 TaxID=3366089 RepID=UPI00382EF1D0
MSAVAHGRADDVKRNAAAPFHYAFHHDVPDEFVRLPEPTASEGSENVLLTAMCIGTEEVDGGERLSMGLLAVTVRLSEHSPAQRLFTAEGIHQATARKFFSNVSEDRLEEISFPLGEGLQGPQDMVLAFKLPCGPGVMSTSLRTLRLPALEAGISVPPLPVAALQLIVPAPHSYCVYVTISTPSVFLLDSYSARLAHIGRTLKFGERRGTRSRRSAERQHRDDAFR